MNRPTILFLLCCVTLGPAYTASAEIVFSDFSSTAGIELNGNAAASNDVLRLTPASFRQRGSAWFATPQRVESEFETVFQFQISEVGGSFDDALGNPGGDGFAFVFQDSGVSALGAFGAQMGYGGTAMIPGISKSVAVEFDTWFNPASEFDDPNSNHISVHTRGLLPNNAHEDFSIGAATAVPDFSDGNVHTGKIHYVAGSLSIFVDDLLTPRLTVAVDLPEVMALTDGEAWVGFTSSTFNAWENHDVLNWSFKATAIPEPSTFAFCGMVSLIPIVRRRRRRFVDKHARGIVF